MLDSAAMPDIKVLVFLRPNDPGLPEADRIDAIAIKLKAVKALSPDHKIPPELVADAGEDRQNPAAQRAIHPGERLVEQQKLGRREKRPAESQFQPVESSTRSSGLRRSSETSATQAAESCMHTFGGYGFCTEFDVERKWRETRLFRTAPISTNMVLAYIGQNVLGMPRSY